jgi:hypothetical protein
MNRAVVSIVAVVVLAGCGGTSHQSSPTVGRSATIATAATIRPSKTTARTRPSQNNNRQTLEAAMREALVASHHLSVRVLWTNRVPGNATRSVRGPALAGMRASAHDREKKGIRVRMVHDEYRIVSVVLGRSLTTGTAVAESIQTVLPSYLNGRPRGRSIKLDERARISLRRLGTSHAFVIWSIGLLK